MVQTDRQSLGLFGVLASEGVDQSGVDVREVSGYRIGPPRLNWGVRPDTQAVDETEEVAEVPLPDVIEPLQSAEGIAAHKLMELIARTAERIRQPLDQCKLAQPGEGAKVRPGDRLGSLTGETTDKDPQRLDHRPIQVAEPPPGVVQHHLDASMPFLDRRPVGTQRVMRLPQRGQEI